MDHHLEKVYHGIILEEEEDLTLMHLCRLCEYSSQEIIQLVEEGIIEPMGRTRREWRFTFTTTERIRKIKRLKNDFELDLSGIALVMHLLDRIDELESGNIQKQTGKNQ